MLARSAGGVFLAAPFLAGRPFLEPYVPFPAGIVLAAFAVESGNGIDCPFLLTVGFRGKMKA